MAFCLLQNVQTGAGAPPSSLFNLYRLSFGGLKRTGPSSAEVRNEWSYTSTPPIRLVSVDRDNFTFLNQVHRDTHYEAYSRLAVQEIPRLA
jgi:hypothetical protein